MTLQVGDEVIALPGSTAAQRIINDRLIGIVVSTGPMRGYVTVHFSSTEGSCVPQLCRADCLQIVAKKATNKASKKTKFGEWVNAIST